MSKNPKWAKLQLKMLYSEAFNSLNAPSIKVLMYILMQIKWENTKRSKSKKDNWIVTNNGEISLPYSTFKKPPFKMHNGTITRSIDSLLACGFITITEQGGSKKNHLSKYSYCEKWIIWKKDDEPFEVRRPYHKRGFQNKHT